MNAPNHTPGPWHIDPDPRIDGADQVCEANGNTVAFVATGRDCDEHEANGQLIAAAPELLATCQMARELLSRLGPRPDLDEHRRWDAVLEELRRVIEKATKG